MSVPRLFTYKNYLRNQRIVHLALLAGQLIILFVFCFTVHKDAPLMDDNFLIPVILISALTFIGSEMIMNWLVKRIPQSLSLRDKLIKYQSAKIVSLAVLESGCFFALIFYLLSNNYLYLGIAIFFILFFALRRPNSDKIINHLQLNETEKAILISKEAIN